MSFSTRAHPALLSLFVLASCGGNGGGGGAEPEVDGRSVRAAVATVPAGTQCDSGGYRIDSGVDSNGNGQLDSSEVTLSQYVCNGNPGTSGVSALVRAAIEAPGAACATGGVRVAAGLDSNGNSVLDVAEETASAAICNGAQGATGAAGATGLSSLTAIVAEAAGANCTYGGTKTTSGLDSNRNDVLDAGEVTSTQYVCNGAGINWETVSATSAQMQANRGYIAGHASQMVTLALPASPAVGDIVQVTGMGAGGWRIAQNAGQRINLTGLKAGWAGTWVTAVAPGAGITAVASSSDGCRLASSAGSNVLTSSDCGLTWNAVDTGQPVFELASSGDGMVLLATYGDPTAGGATSYGVLLSVDGGGNWTAPFPASVYGTPGHYRLAAVSRSGNHLVIADGTTLHRSADRGQNWTATAAPALAWRSMAITDSGQKIVAVSDGSPVWMSEDGGASWSSRAPTLFWRQIVMTPDGSKVAGAADGAWFQVSSDGGQNWVGINGARAWTSAAMSDDGRYLLGATGNDYLYGSRDGGQTWRTAGASSAWRSLAMSDDGRSLLAAGSLGAQHSLSDTRPGALGYIAGTSDEALALQYVGGGRFNLLNWTGIFVAR